MPCHRFSDKALRCELPLYRGSLQVTVHLTNPSTAREAYFLDMVESDIKWGKPREMFTGMMTLRGINRETEEFWADASLIQF